MKIMFDLNKALDKTKLVQVQRTVQGKNGQYQRMQWVKPSDVKDTDRVVGQQPNTPPKARKVSHMGDLENGIKSINRAIGKEHNIFNAVSVMGGGKLGEQLVYVSIPKLQTESNAKKVIEEQLKREFGQSVKYTISTEKDHLVVSLKLDDAKTSNGSTDGKKKADDKPSSDKPDDAKTSDNKEDDNSSGKGTGIDSDMMVYSNNREMLDYMATKNTLQAKKDAIVSYVMSNLPRTRKGPDGNGKVSFAYNEKYKNVPVDRKMAEKFADYVLDKYKDEYGVRYYVNDEGLVLDKNGVNVRKQEIENNKILSNYRRQIMKDMYPDNAGTYHFSLLGSSVQKKIDEVAVPLAKKDKDYIELQPIVEDVTTTTPTNDSTDGKKDKADTKTSNDSTDGKRDNKSDKSTSTSSTSPSKHITGKNMTELVSNLKAQGYGMDAADQRQPQDKVTLFKDGKTYTATFNKYSDGGVEVTGLKETTSVTNFKNGFVRYNPDGETPPYHGGKTYKYFASRKDDTTGKYFDSQKEAEDYVNGDKTSSDKSDNTPSSDSSKFDASEFSKLKSDRTKALQYLKDNGISWKETDNEGINWMRACMAASRAQNSAANAPKKDTASKPSTDTKTAGKSSETAKKAVKDLLAAHGNDRAKVIQVAKASGVTWKESDNDGINWMRASLAIQKHYESGKTVQANAGSVTPSKDTSDSKDNKTQDKKVTISDLKKPTSNGTSTSLSVGGYKITISKHRNVGANSKQNPSFYHIDVVDKDGENVFRTDKTDWSDIKYHAQRYIDASKSDIKSASDKTSNKPKYEGGDHSEDSFAKFLEFTKTDSHAEYLLERIEEAREQGKSVGRTESDWIEALKKYCGYEMKSKTQSKDTKSDAKPTKDKPLVTSDTKSGRPYQLWESNGKIYGSLPGQQDSRDARAIKDFTSAGFDSLDEVKDYIKKYF